MRATGIVRKIDNTGRIVVPKELRAINGIGDGDPIEFYTDDEENIILHKYVPYEDWTKEELREALFAAAKDAGRNPEEYLDKVRKEPKTK
ncbi:AbrB/MazE/SpoVT family DNA-binding domain-containing protein [Caproiciproducens sp.]